LAILAPSPGTVFLAQVGVVLLIFMVGLEFSFSELVVARTAVLIGGLEVTLTSFIVAASAIFLGNSWQAALVMGGIAAQSSTAIALKQLSDEGELGTQHGRLATGILLFQDVAMVPFLVLVGGEPYEQLTVITFALQVLVACIALAVIAMVSGPVFRATLSWIAQARSAELFLLYSLALALGTAVAAQAAGLSRAIGAFLAGVAVGESDFRHQIEDNIRPFRDVLIGLFFVMIGMQVDPRIIAAAPLSVLGWIAVLTVSKTVLVTAILKALGWPTFVAVRVGVVLAHGDEFGLLLLTEAMRLGIIDTERGQSILVALVLTMSLAPLLIRRSAAIAERIAAISSRDTGRAMEEDAAANGRPELRGHLILCGCGRVGHLVATVIEAAKLPYIAIESDPTRFIEAKRAGHRVMFGDASQTSILDRAKVEHARVLVVTFHKRGALERLLHYARYRNPAIVSIVSTADVRDTSTVADLGATVIFPENLAAGLELANQALIHSGFSREEAARVITDVRAVIGPD
jgi:monovalent cation:H+ antiporter-2, CPA2 family